MAENQNTQRQLKYSKRLAKPAPNSSLPRPHINCIACNWRRAANEAMRGVIEKQPDAEDYTGFTFGLSQGALVISQYHLAKQVAAVVVPIDSVPGWLDSIADYVAALAASIQATGEVAEDEPEEASDVQEETEEE